MHRNLSLVHHEAGLLIRLTLPLLFAQLSQTAMGFVDTVMAGRGCPCSPALSAWR